MSITAKHILIGGAVAVGVVLIARRIASAQAAAAKPTGIVGVVDGLSKTYDSLKTLAYRAPSTSLEQGGIPYGPTASDGTAAVSDATGVRQTRALVPATNYYDPKLAGLA